jgi:hypothetical protein
MLCQQQLIDLGLAAIDPDDLQRQLVGAAEELGFGLGCRANPRRHAGGPFLGQVDWK